MKELLNDKSLDDINTLKLIICVLSFITVCFALILFLLLPTLKNFKELNILENSHLATLQEEQANLQFNQERINDLKEANAHSFSQFEQKFNPVHFRELLEKYFQNVVMKELENTNELYLTNNISIDASMDKPQNLYDFLDNLKNFESLVKISPPLIMKAQKTTTSIHFNAKVYSAIK
ncbi:hypothetical protein FMM55_00095 [Campylobacter sp. LR196d]|uniref:hypothetical protein n=1 Tax=Campylobacter sp. LR196d TaxID=2593543 RepID=UPI00123A8EF5|nr:hypothetical protein [Campylobacter sp. LR196d]KAA6228867.1 hypothetical protein FMM55_00095 [Campylobacter sp. LR196d]